MCPKSASTLFYIKIPRPVLEILHFIRLCYLVCGYSCNLIIWWKDYKHLEIDVPFSGSWVLSEFWTISHHMIFGLRLHMHWPSGSFQICGLLARYHATRLWRFLCRKLPITTLSTSQSNIILIIEMSFGKSIIIGKNNCFL